MTKQIGWILAAGCLVGIPCYIGWILAAGCLVGIPCHHRAPRAYMPTLERLEVITTKTGETGDGGNTWGADKNRIIRTPDGTLYTTVTTPGRGYDAKGWDLYKRVGPNDWKKINSGTSGREPVNLLAGPKNEVYIVSWPNNIPTLLASRDGGITFTSERISGNWTINDHPYASAAITPLGDIYLLRSNGLQPGYHEYAYRSHSTGQWSSVRHLQTDLRSAYAFLLPTDTKQFDFADSVDVLWSTMGWTQPSGAFNYVWPEVRNFHTPNVDTTQPTYTTVKEVTKTNGNYVNAFENDGYRDTKGRVHVMYSYQDASTNENLQGMQAVFDTNGVLQTDAPISNIQCPDGAREIQDTTGMFWILTTCGSSIEISQAGTADGTTISPFTSLSLGSTSPAGYMYIAAPRNGSLLQDYIDGVFPTNQGAGWVYFRIRLQQQARRTHTRRHPHRRPSSQHPATTDLTDTHPSIPTPAAVQPRPAAVNLVQNGSFESRMSPWYFNINNGHASATQDCTTGISDRCSAKVSVTSSPGNIYDMALTQGTLSLTGAQTYTVSFRVKTTRSHQVIAAIQQNYSPYGYYARKAFTVAADGNWHQYSYTFTQPSGDSNCLLSLDVGAQTGAVWFDNVSLSP